MHKVLSDIINATRKRVVELKKQIPFDAIEKWETLSLQA